MLLQLIRTVALWEMLKIVHDLKITESLQVVLFFSGIAGACLLVLKVSVVFFTPYQEVVEGTHGLIFLPLG